MGFCYLDINRFWIKSALFSSHKRVLIKSSGSKSDPRWSFRVESIKCNRIMVDSLFETFRRKMARGLPPHSNRSAVYGTVYGIVLDWFPFIHEHSLCFMLIHRSDNSFVLGSTSPELPELPELQNKSQREKSIQFHFHARIFNIIPNSIMILNNITD